MPPKPETSKNDFISLGFVLNLDRQLRAPLSTILGMLDILKSTSLTNEQRQYISNLEFASEEMNQLLQSLQMIIESETSKYKLAEDPFLFGDIMKQIHRELDQIQSATDQRCSVEVIGVVPQHVIGDRHAILEIISGLMAYVCTCGKAPARLELKLTQETGNQVYFQCKIRQANTKLTKARMRQIFGQVDSDTPIDIYSEKVAMPVLLARSMVHQYGSAIKWNLEDNDLEMEFFVHLKKSAKAKTGTGKILPTDFKSSARVLVVEDLELNQIVTKLMLENYGCTVDIASNGSEAVEMFHPDQHDLIIMDIEMPVMDGLEATSILRDRYGKDIPIIALSADALGNKPEFYLKEGFDDYLTKPVKKETLALKIMTWADSQETVA